MNVRDRINAYNGKRTHGQNANSLYTTPTSQAHDKIKTCTGRLLFSRDDFLEALELFVGSTLLDNCADANEFIVVTNALIYMFSVIVMFDWTLDAGHDVTGDTNIPNGWTVSNRLDGVLSALIGNFDINNYNSQRTTVKKYDKAAYLENSKEFARFAVTNVNNGKDTLLKNGTRFTSKCIYHCMMIYEINNPGVLIHKFNLICNNCRSIYEILTNVQKISPINGYIRVIGSIAMCKLGEVEQQNLIFLREISTASDIKQGYADNVSDYLMEFLDHVDLGEFAKFRREVYN
jgi:hypothetical protein